jgi:predicted double-glycine peptidase
MAAVILRPYRRSSLSVLHARTTLRIVLSAVTLNFSVPSGAAHAASIEIGGQGQGARGDRVSVPLLSFKNLRDRNVVRQGFDYSCGAAALATLISYGLSDPVTEREIILEILNSLDRDEESLRHKEGFSLLDLQRVAQRRGYKAQGFRIAPEYLDKLQGPVIVFIKPQGYEHFAVLKGTAGDRAYLADPSLGNVRRALYDFLDMWLEPDGKGIIFVVEPEESTDERRNALFFPSHGPDRPEMLSARQLLEAGRPSSPLTAAGRR